jgi:hypothetical protein
LRRRERESTEKVQKMTGEQSDAKTTERAIVSVKGGENVGVPMIRDLKGVKYPRLQGCVKGREASNSACRCRRDIQASGAGKSRPAKVGFLGSSPAFSGYKVPNRPKRN